MSELSTVVPFTSLIIPLALQKQKDQHDNSKPVINMAEETYGVRQRDLAEKYSDEQIVEVLQKDPVACRGKCNTILKNLTKFKKSFYYSFYL